MKTKPVSYEFEEVHIGETLMFTGTNSPNGWYIKESTNTASHCFKDSRVVVELPTKEERARGIRSAPCYVIDEENYE
jgi:hypothetical protein